MHIFYFTMKIKTKQVLKGLMKIKYKLTASGVPV